MNYPQKQIKYQNYLNSIAPNMKNEIILVMGLKNNIKLKNERLEKQKKLRPQTHKK